MTFWRVLALSPFIFLRLVSQFLHPFDVSTATRCSKERNLCFKNVAPGKPGEMLRKKALEDAEGERGVMMKKREAATFALIETQKANAYLKSVKEEDAKRKDREERGRTLRTRRAKRFNCCQATRFFFILGASARMQSVLISEIVFPIVTVLMRRAFPVCVLAADGLCEKRDPMGRSLVLAALPALPALLVDTKTLFSQRSAMLHDAKQKERQRLIDRQAAQLAQMQSNESARVEKQVLEKQLADEEKRLAKEARLQRMANDVLLGERLTRRVSARECL